MWLNRVQDRMRSSLRLYMGEAVVAYEEKPREQWLFDYPAQVSLCGTQIWWTTEVNIAFSRLEEVRRGSYIYIAPSKFISSLLKSIFQLFVCRVMIMLSKTITKNRCSN